MNWKWKARIQNVVAAMPMSDRLYYAMQRTVGNLKAGRSDPFEWLDAALSIARLINSAGGEVEGGRFLEVGTGRSLGLPLGLWLCGANSVMTVDLNTYLSEPLVMETLASIRSNREKVLQMFEAHAETARFEERFERLNSFSGGLRDFLDLTSIEYAAPADAARLPVKDASFDFHISHAVLEHIPGEAISRILTEARRVLAPGGLLVHIIDPSDHFSHDDASITAVNFLQFSEGEWQRWAGNKFMYHNRLRACEHLELFRRAGVRVLKQREAIDEASLKTLRNGFRLDRKFQGLSPEQLAVRSLILVGDFKDAGQATQAEPSYA